MKTSEEITFGMVIEMWHEYLANVAGHLIEEHLVLRAIRIRTACTSPLHRYFRARQRRKIEKRLLWVGRQLERNADERKNNFKAEHVLHKDQALLQAELLDL